MSRRPQVKLRLYVAGGAPNSNQAVANLSAFCSKQGPGACDIEVVDVFREPKRALADRVFMTPTLVTLGPGPARRVVGTLSETQALAGALGLEAGAA